MRFVSLSYTAPHIALQNDTFEEISSGDFFFVSAQFSIRLYLVYFGPNLVYDNFPISFCIVEPLDIAKVDF